MLRAGAHQQKLDVVPTLFTDQVIDRLDDVAHAIGISHHANIADEMLAPFFKRGIGPDARVGDLRRGANDEHIVRRLATAPDSDVAHRLVRGDHHVCEKVRAPFRRAHGPVQQATFAELGLEHLRADVVHIVNDPRAGELVRRGNQKQQVGRVAEMQDIEAVPPPGFPKQPELAPESRAVLAKKTADCTGLLADPVPVNLNAVDDFLRLCEAAHPRANDNHLVACIAQCARFLPDPAVERHRQVLDDDANAGLLFAHQQNPS